MTAVRFIRTAAGDYHAGEWVTFYGRRRLFSFVIYRDRPGSGWVSEWKQLGFHGGQSWREHFATLAEAKADVAALVANGWPVKEGEGK